VKVGYIIYRAYRAFMKVEGDEAVAIVTFLKRVHKDWHNEAIVGAELKKRAEDTLAVLMDETGFITADQIPSNSKSTPTPNSSNPQQVVIPATWRRGDYFFCESCRQRKQWFMDSPPWPGAICRTCYNGELARIEAARGRTDR
jgi:hypothetical protein